MKKLWNFLSDRYITSQMDELEAIHNRIINRYILILSFALILHAVADLIILKTPHFYITGSIGAGIFFTTFFTRLRFMWFYPFLFSVCLILTIFYYSSANGFDNGLSLYYIVFLSTTPIVMYDSIYRFVFIPILFILVIVLFTFSNYYNFHIFPTGGSFVAAEKLRYITIFNVFLFSGINTYFIISKQQMIIFQYNKIKRTETLITNLKNKLININNHDVQPGIDQVVRMAMDSDATFIPSFNLLFPDMQNRLLAINAQMTSDEFRFCALLKLGFSTKDISTYDNVTVRSVQARKNRLRKSFNIASETDLYNWIASI